MSGNVWEWTVTEYNSGKSDDVTNREPRVVRGGSWSRDRGNARAAFRSNAHPGSRYGSVGFRVVGVVPSS